MTASSVHGTCAGVFEPLRDLLARNLADGTDAGASLAVVHDGEPVVDLWGGLARTGEAWQRDTIVDVWSTTKTMSALTTLVLADRGAFDLEAPVASYWPEFRDDRVLVRHLLAHTSGMAGWTEPMPLTDLMDLERANRLLAEQEPWWEPGTASGYHMISYGHLLDGLVTAATGVPLADQFRELVAEPLGADFHLGVPEEALGRCADLIPPTSSGVDVKALPEGNLLVATLTNPRLDLEFCNSAEWRRVSLAGINGHGNARSIARVQSAVSHGGTIDGVELLSPAMVDRIFEVQADGLDKVLPFPERFGIGYGLPHPESAPAVPSGRACWWSGYGGSIVVNDLDSRTTVAYAMNLLEGGYGHSPRTDEYVETAFACV